MNLTCGCCGFEAEFTNGEEAFAAGWDAEPYISTHVACPLCPAFFLMSEIPDRHASIHAYWAEHGRPDHFSQDTCLDPEDRIDPERLEMLSSKLSPTAALSLKRLLGNVLVATRKEQEKDRKALADWMARPLHPRWGDPVASR